MQSCSWCCSLLNISAVGREELMAWVGYNKRDKVDVA